MEDFVVIIDFSEGATKAWVEANFESIGGDSSSAHSTTSATAPINPFEGDHWISTITYIDYTYVSGAWIEL